MSGTNVLHPHHPEFDRFLYASVGEDRNGDVVTVLSTLARLGLDPWNEAADLAKMGGEAARARLGQLLSRFRGVPTLGHDHGSVARELILLLPEAPSLRSGTLAGSTLAKGQVVSSGASWAVLAALALFLILMRMVFPGAPGSGG